MSLLLDARKKALQSQNAAGQSGSDLSLEDMPARRSATPGHSFTASDESARMAGQNLFSAKNGVSGQAPGGINRNLLYALGGTIVLLAGGAFYVWNEISGSNVRPAHPIKPPVAIQQPVPQHQTAPVNQAAQQPAPVETAPVMAAQDTKPAVSKPELAHTQPTIRHKKRTSTSHPVQITRNPEDSIDSLLNHAYQAYRSGQFDEAQQQYQQALRMDKNNTDALLGLAVIAQHKHADDMAAYYYSQVLSLDPRNAVANAGISELYPADNHESRLKNLLNEQKNSASLHFALGNQYAEQSRWADAQQAYFDAYKLDSNNAKLAYNLAVSLDHLGQYKLAAEYYQRALQLDPINTAGFDHTQISTRIEGLSR